MAKRARETDGPVGVVYSIGARFAGGGVGNLAYQAVRGLHRQGLLFCLLCGSYRPTEIPAERSEALGWASRGLRKLATYDPSRRLWHVESVLYDAWAARRLPRGDILHAHNHYALRSLRRAKALGMVTVVERVSTHPLYQHRLLSEEYARWGLAYRNPAAVLRRAVAEIEAADYVLIPSDLVRRSFLAEGYPEARLIQLPFGVDTARFCPAPRAEARPFRVLFAGQVGVRKGVPDLLEAWRRLGWRDAELWLLGRVEATFRPLRARWGDLPGVRTVAYTPDPVALFQQADVFAFPTIEEGSALVTYEALACGLPVVTTPNAGSIVRDGSEGFIVPIRDVDALAARLERLRRDEPLRRGLARAARQRAEAHTWERYGAELSARHIALVGAK